MYSNYFGFKEKPFKLVPNPEYVYLSRNHDNALAHLIYAAEHGDGFVLITGEVGTGKTTLCRMFLERTEDQVESAYIFNTHMDSVQLLSAICREFGIDTTGHQSFNDLLDLFNDYLIHKHQANRKVILLIDEAQNLTVENLEMVRMLSNLETTHNKLLQIMLVGQPELGTKLESHELRQLAQRISLSTQLMPLSARETQAFIHHRISIAAQRRKIIFTSAACRRIYRFSRGVPRLINVAADRALMTAYELKRPKVTAADAHRAIKELVADKTGRGARHPWLKIGWMSLSIAFLMVAAFAMAKSEWITSWLSFRSRTELSRLPSADKTDAAASPSHVYSIDIPDLSQSGSGGSFWQAADDGADKAPATPSAMSTASAESPAGGIIEVSDPQASRLSALTLLLSLWQQPNPNPAQLAGISDDFKFFQIAAFQYGLQLLALEDDWPLIKKLNLPAIVALKSTATKPAVFLTLVRWRDNRLTFSDGDPGHDIEFNVQQLRRLALGPIYVFWNNVSHHDAVISFNSPAAAVSWVKDLLQKVGYEQLSPDPVFDLDTHRTILDFQRHQHIDADGLVGPLTKIVLINEARVCNTPRLNDSAGT